MTTTTASDWHGLIDDAAIFPPGNAPLDEAVATYSARASDLSPYVASFVVKDTDLPQARAASPLAIVVTSGAGGIAGPVQHALRHEVALAGLEIAVRDLDDPAGNVRRVVAAIDAARADGLDAETPVYVELPAAPPEYSWLAAADEVAAAELRLKFRTGGLDAAAFPAPQTLAAWIDAALDRETPFKCTAGLHRAVRHQDDDGFAHHGFLNVLLATEIAFDGGSPADTVAALETPEPTLPEGPARARRWFTSFGSCSVTEPVADLRTLGLIPSD